MFISIRLRNIFKMMLERCYNHNNKNYNNYGEKGIHICNEWKDNPSLFNDWTIDNGYDDNLTIDRIDETKDYCPENCRWITLEENAKWKSTTNYIEVNGILDSGRGWSRKLNLPINYINKYLRDNGLEKTIEFIKQSDYFL